MNIFYRDSSENYVIILGDLNTTHQPIDVYDDDKWCYKDSHSRKWLSELLSKKNDSSDELLFTDAFRHLNPNEEKSFTCWNVQLDCRKTNFGSRLDYILIDHKLLPYLAKCTPLTDFLGSDHCPVVAEFDERLNFTPPEATQYSEHCTKVWPEFGFAKQTSIKGFCVSREEAERAKLQKAAAQVKRPSSPVEQQAEYPVATNSNQNNSNKKAKKNPTKPPVQKSVLNYFTSYKWSGPVEPSKATKSEETKFSPVKNDASSTRESPTFNKVSNNSFAFASPNKSPIKSLSGGWAEIFAQEPPPLCTGHNLPCVKRKVRKVGPTQGKEFFACQKSSVGPKDNPDTRCNFFQWANKHTTKGGLKEVQNSPVKSPEDINELMKE